MAAAPQQPAAAASRARRTLSGPSRWPAPSPDDITEAFWQACHGGQRRTAERLLASGADLDETPGYSGQTATEVAAELGTQRENLVTWLHDRKQGT